MGKKKRRHPDIEEVLGRSWCYYCERDFEDLKLLISHQKAKHFKCDRCGRRLNTAGGLSVHMTQVHKETLNQVENALPHRQALDVEIFGMEGIPPEILEQHRTAIIQNYYQEQEERRIATGNPAPGQKENGPRKKLKIENAEDLKKRFAEHRAKVAAQKAGIANGAPVPASTFNGSFPPPQPGFQDASFGPPGAAPPTYSSPSLPQRPGGVVPAPSGLPQRPAYTANYWAGPGAPPPGYVPQGMDAAQGPPGDEIDQMIRNAEAGNYAQKKSDDAPAAPAEVLVDKKSKKEKGRMVYADTDVSPEERMAQLPRYAYIPSAA